MHMALSYSFEGNSYILVGGCGDATIIVPDFYNDGINGIFPVIAVSSYSFFQCNSLKYLELGKNITFIDYAAFARCSNLETVIVKSKNISISDLCFTECTNLKYFKCEGNSPQAFGTSTTIFSLTDPNFKLYRKKYFVTGWNSTFGGKPVVLWSDNVIKSGGTGKLIAKPNYELFMELP